MFLTKLMFLSTIVCALIAASFFSHYPVVASALAQQARFLAAAVSLAYKATMAAIVTFNALTREECMIITACFSAVAFLLSFCIDWEAQSLKAAYARKDRSWQRGKIPKMWKVWLGVDGTLSNMQSPVSSFWGDGTPVNLHDMSNPEVDNHYVSAIKAISAIFKIDSDLKIPSFVFGCKNSRDKRIQEICNGTCGEIVCALRDYMAQPNVMASPTSFVPMIKAAIQEYRDTSKEMMVILLGDGGVTDVEENQRWLMHASKLPIFFLYVGIGHGNFGTMQDLDDDVKNRDFDNVNVKYIKDYHGKHGAKRLVLDLLDEIPKAYATVTTLRKNREWGTHHVANSLLE